MKEYAAAQTRHDRFQELTTEVDACDAKLGAAVEDNTMLRCGELLAQDHCNREELAQMAGERVWFGHEQKSIAEVLGACTP